MKRIAVITGGSSGIGLNLVDLFARNGFFVFELSRSGASKDGIEHIDTDLKEESSVQSAFAQIAAQFSHIDVLVNNAGMGISGAAEYTALEEAKAQFDVNLFGTVCAVKHALPCLRAAKGRIVNISSAAAVLPVPFQAFYSASKAAVNAYSLALANEVKRFGVTVSIIMPGDTKTGFTKARQQSSEGNAAYGGAIGRSVSLMEHDEQHGMAPEYVAKIIYKAATKKRAKAMTVVGLKLKFLAALAKPSPAALVNMVIRKIYAK